jgi:hypothetical protein
MMFGDEGAPATGQAQFMNAEEAWAIYDTIQVRTGITEKRIGYGSYVALGGAPEWAFFDQRKIGDVGLAYTNRDSNEGLEFPFLAYSLGVRFVAPEGLCEPIDAAGPQNTLVHAIFSRMILEHVGFKFKVSQDEKLLHTCYLAPDGLGPQGVNIFNTNNPLNVLDQGSYSNTNGQSHISGRWKFPAPIQMPRGCTFNLTMVPSEYARGLLAAMPGPSNYTFSLAAEASVFPSSALIRVDIIGKRAVQQRNALHY